MNKNRVTMKKTRHDEKIAIRRKKHVMMKKVRYDEKDRDTTEKSRYDGNVTMKNSRYDAKIAVR